MCCGNVVCTSFCFNLFVLLFLSVLLSNNTVKKSSDQPYTKYVVGLVFCSCNDHRL